MSSPPPLPPALPPNALAPAPPAAPQPNLTALQKWIRIVCGLGAVIVAIALFYDGVYLLINQEQGESGWPPLLMIATGICIGVASIQFFFALERNRTGLCKVCMQPRPTISGAMNRHIGAIVLMFHSHITGHLCKDCIGQVFCRFTPLTLGAGWWGILSFFITPLVIVNNIAFYVRSRFMK